MPNIGEARTASELGYKGHAIYLYCVCDSCDKERWVREKDVRNGKGFVCRSCGYPASNRFKNKVKQLRDEGARRASELGKSVFKKRDPWYLFHPCSICGEGVWHQRKDLHRVCKKCQYIVRKVVSGAAHPNWGGGRYNHGSGYVIVQVSPTSPYYSMAHATGYMLEHRLIMAEHLGRCLLDSEVVHHINRDKQDNRIGNLELLPNDASHLPYIRLQQQVMKLEKQIQGQNTEIQLLKWHIRELEHGNPVPSRGINNSSGVRRGYTGGTLDDR